jgi:mannose-1-phosphate guanylyltransferase
VRTSPTPPWALILAGGDGIRLRPLTTQIVSDLRPKQFCPVLDGETLLDRTRRRVDLLVQSHRHLIVVSRPHEAYFRDLATELAPDRLLVQPDNRGTAAGIVYPLLRLTYLVGDTPVAVFPSDHAVSDALVFIGYVQRAVEVVHSRRDVIVLLGIEAGYPETEYGWIEPCNVPLPIDGEPVFPIRRFWEKPSPPLAQQLFEQGCLWNSFIMVGWVTAFLKLVWATAPDVIGAFEPARSRLGSVAEGAAVERVYSELPSLSFSDCVLARASDRLVTVRVKGVEWSDLGSPERLVASLHRAGRMPSWLSQVDLAGTT